MREAIPSQSQMGQTFIEYMLYARDFWPRFHESSLEIGSTGLARVSEAMSSLPSAPKERWCCSHFCPQSSELHEPQILKSSRNIDSPNLAVVGLWLLNSRFALGVVAQALGLSTREA